MIGAIGQGSGFAQLLNALQAPGHMQRKDAPQASQIRETGRAPNEHGSRLHGASAVLSPRPLQQATAVESSQSPRHGAFQRLSAEEFGQLRARSLEAQSVSELSFELTTQEGDRISLQFEQMDYQRYAEDADHLALSASMERAVSMTVQGDLSDKELAAIDRAIQSASDIAARFFGGDLSEPAAVMASLDFDTQQLASLSLDMSQRQSLEMTRVLGPAQDGVQGLASRNTGIANLIDSLGAAQKKMIDQLSEVLEAPSAVKLARGLVPELIG